MIHLAAKDKNKIISDYISKNSIKKVYILGDFNQDLNFGDFESVKYADIIMYKFFYRLLKEIDSSSLIVVNECLRTKNRYDLTYNCIRQYLLHTPHKLIFQYLPIIDSIEDFMILFDFDTRSQWKREKFNKELLKHCELAVNQKSISIIENKVEVSAKTKQDYENKKKKLFSELALKDPHTLPRNLQKVGGKEKLTRVENSKFYYSGNNRFKLPNLETYKKGSFEQESYCIFDLPFRERDWVDFLSRTKQNEVEVLTTDLKVDEWFIERYQTWIKELNNAYTDLQQD